jgi:tripartite-type tricarboxylate transporter receptor subunit TctC
MAALAAAPADGYTVMFTGSSFTTVSLLMPNLPFTMEAFAPLSLLTVGPTILCVPSRLGIQTMTDFVAAAKTQPGKWSYGSTGVGTTLHLAGEIFKMDTGVDLTHVSYRGTPALVADLLENRIQLSIIGVADVRQYLLSGQLRGLAVSYTERLRGFPDLPTCAELGYPNIRVSNDFGVAVRSGTPAPIRARLEEAYRTAVRQSEIAQKLADLGLIVVGISSEEFSRAVVDDTARYREVIRVADIKLE